MERVGVSSMNQYAGNRTGGRNEGESDFAAAFPIRRVLSPEGEVVGKLPPGLTPEDWRKFYRLMVLGRLFDQRAVSLQRQGRMGTYPPLMGQEAAQVGSAYALRQEEWLIPSFREHLAARVHGLPFRYTLLYWMGHEEGNNIPPDVNVFTTAVSIGDQIPHGVGAAMAARLQGDGKAVLVYFGDGATSEGDFHEACNFAGVYRVPAVLFCQNNQYAISLRCTQQTASPTIAQKAVAYDIVGERVDGNDVFAVYGAVARALERARAGEGPTLIEAVTYRVGPHTTADDPRRYRDISEEKVWREERDPISRLRRFLERQGLWSDEEEEEVRAEALAEVQAEVEAAEAYHVQVGKDRVAIARSIFDSVFARKPDYLVRQEQECVPGVCGPGMGDGQKPGLSSLASSNGRAQVEVEGQTQAKAKAHLEQLKANAKAQVNDQAQMDGQVMVHGQVQGQVHAQVQVQAEVKVQANAQARTNGPVQGKAQGQPLTGEDQQSQNISVNLIESINQGLRLGMQATPRVILMGQDIGRNGGVFRATEGLWQEFGPDRVLDTPLAESAIIGTALGMAAYGLRPVAEIQFEGFSYLCFDQIVTQVARLRNRSRGRYGAPVIIRIPHGGGVHAPEHHSEAPEALFVHMPGLQVVIPATPYDAKGLLLAALEQDDPVIFFEPKRIYRAFRQEIPAGWYTVPIGKARVVRPGSDVTLVSWGATLHTALAASSEADRRASVSVEVIDLRSLKPWDEETVLRSVRRTGRLVVVQEAWRTGGFGSEIISRVAQEALFFLESPPVLVSGWDIPVPLAQLEEEQLPSVERVVAALEQAVRS